MTKTQKDRLREAREKKFRDLSRDMRITERRKTIDQAKKWEAYYNNPNRRNSLRVRGGQIDKASYNPPEYTVEELAQEKVFWEKRERNHKRQEQCFIIWLLVIFGGIIIYMLLGG